MLMYNWIREKRIAFKTYQLITFSKAKFLLIIKQILYLVLKHTNRSIIILIHLFIKSFNEHESNFAFRYKFYLHISFIKYQP